MGACATEAYESTFYQISVMQAVMAPLSLRVNQGASTVTLADPVAVENERVNCWSTLRSAGYDRVGKLYTQEQIMICSIVMSVILVLTAVVKFKVCERKGTISSMLASFRSTELFTAIE